MSTDYTNVKQIAHADIILSTTNYEERIALRTTIAPAVYSSVGYFVINNDAYTCVT